MRFPRWLGWILFLFGASLLLAAAGVYVLVRSFPVAPAIARGSTLTVDLVGELPEDSLYDLSGPFFEVERHTFADLLLALDRSKTDPRVQNLLLRLQGVTIGWGRAEELREAIHRFKESGKPVVAFLEYAQSLDYFLATAADKVLIHPQSVLDLRGLRAEVTFVRTTLDKLGVEAEFEQIGAYKNAPEIFTRESLSDAHRESLEAIVSDVYRRLVSGIAAARGLDSARVEEILDQGPFPAVKAVDLGLADGLRYVDEIEKELAPKNADYHPVTVGRYRRQHRRRPLFGSGTRIAIVYGVGAITMGASDEDLLFGRTMGAETLSKSFRGAREDASVRAVVFRIDSPGGIDVASDIIWREAALTREKKPVVVSMGDVAASGGYWIATASDVIVAEPSTVTGSIGIYGGKFNLKGFYDKIGFRKEGVQRGASADFWSDYRSFSDEERERFRQILHQGYRRFLEKVAASRNKSIEEVDAIARGRVWTGAQAVERGLVDELGGLERAIAVARERAGIPAEDRVELLILPERRSFIQVVLERMMAGAHAPLDPSSWTPEALLARSPILRALHRGSAMAMMPFGLRLR